MKNKAKAELQDDDNQISEILEGDANIGKKLNKESLNKLKVNLARFQREWKAKKQSESWDDISRDPVSLFLSLPILPFLYFERKTSKYYVERSQNEWDRKIAIHQNNATEGIDRAPYIEKIKNIDEKIEKGDKHVTKLQTLVGTLFGFILGLALGLVFGLPLALDSNFELASLVIGGAIIGGTLIGTSLGYGNAYLKVRDIREFSLQNGSQQAVKLIEQITVQQSQDSKNKFDIEENKEQFLMLALRSGTSLEELYNDDIGRNKINNFAEYYGISPDKMIDKLNNETKTKFPQVTKIVEQLAEAKELKEPTITP